MQEPSELLPIRAVAEATGIAPGTLRIWERRYDRPEPVRLPSGHRRYTGEHVRWLRKIAELLACGRRPGDVVPLPEPELDQLLALERGSAATSPVAQRVVELASRLDADGLDDLLRDALEEHGARDVVDAVVAPALTAVGRAWAEGTLEVCHEHFVADALLGFLRSLSSAPRPVGRTLVVTTLPGELHGLGAAMAAAVCRLRGFDVRSLGVNTPVDDVARAAHQCDADAVLVSISIASGGVATDRLLAGLRAALRASVRLLAGGRGARRARRGPRGVEYASDFGELDAWLTGLAPGAA